MTPATLSSKYQLVIPKEVREKMDFRPGMQFQFVPLSGLVALVPLRPISELMGTLKGMDTSNIREKKDRPL